MNKIQLTSAIDNTDIGQGFDITGSGEVGFGLRCVEVLGESHYIYGSIGGSCNILFTGDFTSEMVADKVIDFMNRYNAKDWEKYEIVAMGDF